ncbi:MAG: hypothetical protein ABIR70_21070 [Bryobacteraceae bacterium]
MSRQFLIMLSAGLLVIGVALYSTISVNQKHLLTLEGSITDVRISELTPESTLVILDFTAMNPSKVRFEVKEVGVERTDGTPLRGDLLSKAETVRFLEYAKLPMPNPTIGVGDRVQGGETVKRMIAARFDTPAAGLQTATYRIGFLDYNNVAAKVEGKK